MLLIHFLEGVKFHYFMLRYLQLSISDDSKLIPFGMGEVLTSHHIQENIPNKLTKDQKHQELNQKQQQ